MTHTFSIKLNTAAPAIEDSSERAAISNHEIERTGHAYFTSDTGHKHEFGIAAVGKLEYSQGDPTPKINWDIDVMTMCNHDNQNLVRCCETVQQNELIPKLEQCSELNTANQYVSRVVLD
jgi:hypothetical protein